MNRMSSGRRVELRLKKDVRRTISRIIWFHTAYHSSFVKRFDMEPVIMNYNVFEGRLVGSIKNYCTSSYSFIKSTGEYVDALSEHIGRMVDILYSDDYEL